MELCHIPTEYCISRVIIVAYNRRGQNKPFNFSMGRVMREATYQARLVRKIKDLFPGCVVIRLDPQQLQGIPDLLILFGSKWAVLEAKVSMRAPRQANQEYYVELLNDMSFAAFICPENEEEVLDALQYAFESERHTRVPEPKQLPLDQLRRRQARPRVSSVYGSEERN